MKMTRNPSLVVIQRSLQFFGEHENKEEKIMFSKIEQKENGESKPRPLGWTKGKKASSPSSCTLKGKKPPSRYRAFPRSSQALYYPLCNSRAYEHDVIPNLREQKC